MDDRTTSLFLVTIYRETCGLVTIYSETSGFSVGLKWYTETTFSDLIQEKSDEQISLSDQYYMKVANKVWS